MDEPAVLSRSSLLTTSTLARVDSSWSRTTGGPWLPEGEATWQRENAAGDGSSLSASSQRQQRRTVTIGSVARRGHLRTDPESVATGRETDVRLDNAVEKSWNWSRRHQHLAQCS